jgi:hypothetical protein
MGLGKRLTISKNATAGRAFFGLKSATRAENAGRKKGC